MLDFGALLKRRTDAEQEAEALDAQIVQAIADGKPDSEIRKLRKKRLDAIEDADDTGEALRVAQDVAQARAEAEKAERLREERSKAREAGEEFVRTAAAVDGALLDLEEASIAHRLAGSELTSALSRAGMLGAVDRMRITNRTGPNARWAAWRSAPTFCKAAEVPRTPGPKRNTLEDLARTLVPNLEDPTKKPTVPNVPEKRTNESSHPKENER